MSERKHTPGPWEHWGGGYIRHKNARDRRGRVLAYNVCTVSLPGANEMSKASGGYGSYADAKEVQEANANLITASPDLLAACEAMLAEMMVWEDEHGIHPAAALARAAIAKATGEPAP